MIKICLSVWRNEYDNITYGGPVQAYLGGASLETFSGESQLKKSPCMTPLPLKETVCHLYFRPCPLGNASGNNGVYSGLHPPHLRQSLQLLLQGEIRGQMQV